MAKKTIEQLKKDLETKAKAYEEAKKKSDEQLKRKREAVVKLSKEIKDYNKPTRREYNQFKIIVGAIAETYLKKNKDKDKWFKEFLLTELKKNTKSKKNKALNNFINEMSSK